MGIRYYTHRAFLPADTCLRLRTAMNAGIAEPAEVLDSDEGRRATVIEIDHRMLNALEHRLDAIRPDLEAYFGHALGEREGAALIRYQAGDGYGVHRDAGTALSWPAAARRHMSIVVFLNGASGTGGEAGFIGGTLRLWNGQVAEDVVPEQGCLVAFPAETLHEVCRVTAGVRDVIVDWFYRPSTTTVST